MDLGHLIITCIEQHGGFVGWHKQFCPSCLKAIEDAPRISIEGAGACPHEFMRYRGEGSARAAGGAILARLALELGLKRCKECGAHHNVCYPSYGGCYTNGMITVSDPRYYPPSEIAEVTPQARALLWERMRALVAEVLPD